MKKIFHLIVLVSVALLFVACSNGGSSSNSPEEKVSVKLGYNLSAKYISKNLNRSIVRSSEGTLYTGKLQITNLDDPSADPISMPWYATLNIDNDDYNGTSNKTIVMKPGEYKFLLVLSNANIQYVSEWTKKIKLEDTNNTKIDIMLRPVVGDKLIDINTSVISKINKANVGLLDKESQDEFKKTFEDGEEKNDATRIVVKTKDSNQTFEFNPNGDNKELYVNLPEGEHQIDIDVIGKNGTMGRTPNKPMIVTIEAGVTTILPIVPLHAEASLNFEVNSTDVNVTHKIPKEFLVENGATFDDPCTEEPNPVDTNNPKVCKVTGGVLATVNGEKKDIYCEVDPGKNCYIKSIIKGGGKNGEDAVVLNLYKDDDGKVDNDDEPFAGSNTENFADTNETTLITPIKRPNTGSLSSKLHSVIGFNVYYDHNNSSVGQASVYVDGKLQGITSNDNKVHTIGFYKGYLNEKHQVVTVTKFINNKKYQGSVNLADLDIENFGVKNIDVNLKEMDPKAFIMTVDIGDKKEFKTFTWHRGYQYNYNIDCGNGQKDDNQQGRYTCEYTDTGKYQISITGDMPHYSTSDESKKYLLSIDQWGDIAWKDMYHSFSQAPNLIISAIDSPNLSSVKSMEKMFYNSDKINQDISHWDVSNIKNMSEMFALTALFNQPLNDWNVSSVTNMNKMFNNAEEFNQPLNDWDVSSVTDMYYMFAYAKSFFQDLSSWLLDSSVQRTGMFTGNPMKDKKDWHPKVD